jgi:hypothetical protein
MPDPAYEQRRIVREQRKGQDNAKRGRRFQRVG